jgi:hypothetical protein
MEYLPLGLNSIYSFMSGWNEIICYKILDENAMVNAYEDQANFNILVFQDMNLLGLSEPISTRHRFHVLSQAWIMTHG